jgi:Cu/Ag efflux pump CusA
MPQGTLPPMIMRMDAGSVPVGYLVFESKTVSLGDLGDLAQNVVRPLVQKNVPGTVAISPFGPNMRSIVVNVDPHKLRKYNLTPEQVSEALAKGNNIIPAGNIYIKDSMPVVANNATVVDKNLLGTIPLKLGKNVSLRDIATIVENFEITMGYAGQVAPNFGIDNMVLFMRGPDDGMVRVAFREGADIKLAEFRERLRKVFRSASSPGWPGGWRRAVWPPWTRKWKPVRQSAGSGRRLRGRFWHPGVSGQRHRPATADERRPGTGLPGSCRRGAAGPRQECG